MAERTSFGRHETFPLRFGWLAKGADAWLDNTNVFEQDDGVVELGVGRNMVDAIRYWLIAAQIVKARGRALEATEIGRLLFFSGGWDPYLEDDATIWLIHWLIASNAEDATTPFWFFNRFHKPEFTSQELQEALAQFVRGHLSVRVGAGTLKNDVALLLRMYEPSHTSKLLPLEESLDSPMALLGLVNHQEGTKVHESRPEYRARLPVAAFSFAVAEMFQATGESVLPVHRLLHGDGTLAAPGAVFRLTEECLIAKIEATIRWLPNLFELRQTAGLHQLYRLQAVEPIEVLRRHYAA